MSRWMIAAAVMALSLSLGLARDDEKKPDEPKPKAVEPKAPDWSKFADHGEVTDVVYKADENSIVFRKEMMVRDGGFMRMKNIDTEYKYAEGALARFEKEPPFFDDKGLKRAAKPGELEKLKKPVGVPGYMMERTDLKPGDIVKLKLCRLTSVSKTKAKPEDLFIKYAFKLGEKGAKDEPKKKP